MPPPPRCASAPPPASWWRERTSFLSPSPLRVGEMSRYETEGVIEREPWTNITCPLVPLGAARIGDARWTVHSSHSEARTGAGISATLGERKTEDHHSLSAWLLRGRIGRGALRCRGDRSLRSRSPSGTPLPRSGCLFRSRRRRCQSRTPPRSGTPGGR